ncbi:glycoside hydrolase family 97 protein [Sphingomonas sp. CARO-RG-8B-R24-01]|uniref:glycoside hydrolase family 97 protein n=1 Tax=Sphingomonas sp. CARO-RG-8B-R24-01 TaxID=2914831 RepID=UPI001F580D2A|nr:glycoside hydrolase family 97 protein [Sphingomonas sp. CARO-RG-8B-R24-01]
MAIRLWAGCALLTAVSLAGCTKPPIVSSRIVLSPNARISLEIGLAHDGSPLFRVRRDGRDVIAPSTLALDMTERGTAVRFDHLVITAVDHGKRDERYAMPGRATPVVSHFMTMTMHVQSRQAPVRRFNLEARVSDQGAAVRIVVPRQAGIDQIAVAADRTQFVFPQDRACLAVRHYEMKNSHEGGYTPIKASALAHSGLYDLPLVCRTGRGGETLALTESGLENFAAAYFAGNGDKNGVRLRLTPNPAKPKAPPVTIAHVAVVTPWRVVMLADGPEDLIASTLVDDLASPSRVADADWVRPGKAAWDWWSGSLAPSVPHAGHNDATYKVYIDFAGRFGLPYMMIDKGWAWRPPGESVDLPNANITRNAVGVHIPELVRYARARHVKVWLWVNWLTLDKQMAQALPLYERLGIAGIKVDFIYRQDQEIVAFYHRLLSEAAKHHLMVDLHAAMVPRGLARTYPNFLTQEGVMGLEYNRWSTKVTSGYNVRTAYTRAIVGPMDYTPGGFRNVPPAQFQERSIGPMVMTTRAQQLALFVVYPSPFMMLADAPSAYEDAAHRPVPGADFLKLVPAAWDETRALGGTFGNSIIVARRKGSDWFVGVLTDEHPRHLAIPLSFLGKGRWHVDSWTDGTVYTSIDRREGAVRSRSGSLILDAHANGGAALRFRPVR